MSSIQIAKLDRLTCRQTHLTSTAPPSRASQYYLYTLHFTILTLPFPQTRKSNVGLLLDLDVRPRLLASFPFRLDLRTPKKTIRDFRLQVKHQGPLRGGRNGIARERHGNGEHCSDRSFRCDFSKGNPRYGSRAGQRAVDLITRDR